MSAKKRQGWRGYMFSRAIAGQMIPQRVQNLVVRVHAEKNGLYFLLSAVEYHLADSYMMLESLYEELPRIEGLIFYSMHMLPESPKARRAIYDAVLRSGAGVRFALEELQILNESDVALIEDIMAVKRLSRSTLPQELLR